MEIKDRAIKYALGQVLTSTNTEMTQQAYLSLQMFNGYDVACAYKDGANVVLKEIEKAISSSDNPLAKLGAVVKVIEKLKGE